MESQRANGTAFGAAVSEERWLRLPCAEYPIPQGLACTACGKTVRTGWLLKSKALVFRCLACFEKARAK